MPFKSPSTAFSLAPLTYWRAAVRSHWNLLLSSQQPQASQPVFIREVLQLHHLCGPPLDLLQEVPVLLMMGFQSWMQHSRCSWEWSRRGESPPLPCRPGWIWHSPGCLWLSVHIASFCWASHTASASSSSPQGCLESILCPDFVCTWDCPVLCAAPGLWPCWTSWGSHRSTALAWQDIKNIKTNLTN